MLLEKYRQQLDNGVLSVELRAYFHGTFIITIER